MHQITAAQFKAAVELDPAWASKLTEPVEITDYCHIDGSEITHLSPLLYFSGKNENGNSASFWGCKSLRIAEGNFEGFVNFYDTDIEKIGDLTCGKNNQGQSANFGGCKSLKIAQGKFEGFAYFAGSSIEKIRDLICGKDSHGCSANFEDCTFLKIAEGEFEGAAWFRSCGIEKIGDLSCGKGNSGFRLNVENCPNLTKIPLTFNPREVRADPKLIEKLEVGRFIQKKREGIVEIEI